MNYVFVYDDAMNILEVSGETIRKFLGNWYIRKFMNPSLANIKSYLKSISNFSHFLMRKVLLPKEN